MSSSPSASLSFQSSSPPISVSPHSTDRPHPHLIPSPSLTNSEPMSTPLSLLASPPPGALLQRRLSASPDDSAVNRRRRDVRAARDRLGEQFELLRRALPDPPPGVELAAKAQVLEHSLEVIQRLMNRATTLSMELAVVSPEATRRWVQRTADDGRKPLLDTVVSVMKLFAAKRKWRYAEWWTLDERQNADEELDFYAGEEDVFGFDGEKPGGVVDDPSNIHGCVVRDTISVMRLGWTLIQRSTDLADLEPSVEDEEDERLAQFAKASKQFEFRPRVGMPGRVWTSRRAEWLINLEDQETFIRSPLAEEFGMKTCLAVPIQFGGHVHSVMAFYSRESRSYSPECYDLVTLLAKSLEEVYSPRSNGPWHINYDPLFDSRGG